ncbi:MAG: restriction endonuclease subunit S [Bacteroidota bacterium]
MDKVDEYLIDENLILIGEDGANLITRSKRLVFMATGKYWVNNHAHILRPINGNLRYYTELLETYDFSLWVSGSAQPKLTSEKLSNVLVLSPPVKEQHQIVQHIETHTTRIDREIAATEKEIALLEEYRQALIAEAVTGKIDVRDYPLD